MSKLKRRSFLKASAGMGAMTLSVGSSAARADLPIPPATGRLYRDAAARRAELYALLGDLPDRERPIRPRSGTSARRTATCSSPGCSTSTASSRCPRSSRSRRRCAGAAPAVLFDHSHGGGYTIGKKEFVEGRSYLQPMPYAKALTAEG